MTFHIRTVADLDELLLTRGWRRRGPDRLVLDVGGLTVADSRAWEAKLSRYYFVCGCEVGSVVMLLALFGYVVFTGIGSGGFAAATWREVGVGVAVCFVAAAVGKLAGLLYARYRLRATIRSLTMRLLAVRQS